MAITESGWLGRCLGRVFAWFVSAGFELCLTFSDGLRWGCRVWWRAVDGHSCSCGWRRALGVVPPSSALGVICWTCFSRGSTGESLAWVDPVARIDWARRMTPGLAGWWRISFSVLTAAATLTDDRSGMTRFSLAAEPLAAVEPDWDPLSSSLGAESSRKSGGGGRVAKSISSTEDEPVDSHGAATFSTM